VIHVVFERRLGRLAAYGPDGRLWLLAEANGEARGVGGRSPHGPGYPVAPGHYRLLGQVEHEPATAEDGPGAIDVGDLDLATLSRIVDAGRARPRGRAYEIASLVAPAGELARFGRSAIVIHGGGPSLAHLVPPEDPLAPYQRLTRGDGGVRMHNADLARLMMILRPAFAEPATVVFTVIGEPSR
jgi:hypothetical protein